MKLPCELIRDLLPLYEDDACSQSSRAIVEEHLQNCESCRGLLRGVLPLPEVEIEAKAEEKAAARSFRKIRRRWAASVLAVLVALPLIAAVVVLSVGQVRGEGFCFTNLDDIYAAARFVVTVCDGDYEKAAQYLDHTVDYSSIQEVLASAQEDYLPKLTPVDIGGERWLVSRDFSEKYLQDYEDAMQTWSYFLFNGVDMVPIPVAVWERLAGQTPPAMTAENGIYTLEDGKRFRLVQTQWGDYLVTEHTWDCLENTETVQWCYTLDLMPETMYHDLLSELEEYAQQQWQSGQDWNAWAKDVTMEEYTALRNAEFVQEMTACRDSGITLEYRGIGDIYNIEGEWTVYVEVTADYGGESKVIGIGLHVSGGRVNATSFYHKNRSTAWMEKLIEAFI